MKDRYKKQVELLIRIMPSVYNIKEFAVHTYEDYRHARRELIKLVRDGLTSQDKDFLVSFESGTPKWELCTAGDLSAFPSVQWKLQNISKLKSLNPQKFEQSIKKLTDFLTYHSNEM